MNYSYFGWGSATVVIAFFSAHIARMPGQGFTILLHRERGERP